jgi:hypothetical protein
MSLGSGTLANLTEPKPHAKGNKLAASGNGKQHHLPSKTMHNHVCALHKDQTEPMRFRHTSHPDFEHVDTHWEQQLTSTKGPTRTAASQTPGQAHAADYEATAAAFARKNPDFHHKYDLKGGECIHPAIKSHVWSSGDHWNLDSNIRKWTNHEMRRTAAGSSHDVHRHDQIQRFVLPPQTTGKGIKHARLCMSGAVSPDCNFLEAWGFDLGFRDRQANPAPLFKPVCRDNMFRAVRSFDRDLPVLTEFKRSLTRSASLPDVGVEIPTLKPEDIAGDTREQNHRDWPMSSKGGPITEHTGEAAEKIDEMAKGGRTFASRSCNYWDSYDHTVKREGARLSCGTHAPVFQKHKEDYPFVDEVELHPAAIYTRKFREQGGLMAMRGRLGNSRHVPGNTGQPVAKTQRL